jgi:hypothetical protein
MKRIKRAFSRANKKLDSGDSTQNQPPPDGGDVAADPTAGVWAELPFAPDLSVPDNRLRTAIAGLESEFVRRPISISHLTLTLSDQ